MRDLEPAGESDVRFVAHAPDDVLGLTGALRGTTRLSERQLDEIAARYEGASPGPWNVFLESEPGIGGCDMIQIGGPYDDYPDMYIWQGDRLAPSANFEFVAAARQDIPRLVSALRSGERLQRGAPPG